MNKIFFITFVACSVVFSFSAHAQSGKQHRNFDREAFFARKNAFITAEMGLTPEEAASFIPLCNELQEKMFEAGRECRKLSKDLKHNENATDADYLKVIDECVSVNIRQAQLEKEYYEKFKKILSPKKLYRYKRADGRFAREFMRGGDDRKEENRKKYNIFIICVFCLDLVLAFKLREGWRRDVGSPFVFITLSLLLRSRSGPFLPKTYPLMTCLL